MLGGGDEFGDVIAPLVNALQREVDLDEVMDAARHPQRQLRHTGGVWPAARLHGLGQFGCQHNDVGSNLCKSNEAVGRIDQ